MLKQILLIPVLFVLGNEPIKKEKPMPQLEKGFKLEAAGKIIESESGHSAPFMVDFDGDGRKDMVIGEFGNGKGRARVYLNTGKDIAPKFDTFTYLQAGGQDAVVEPLCCIGFDPYFVDLNGDGILDVTSGKYLGGYITFYEGTGKKQLAFKEGVKIQQPEFENGDVNDTNLHWLMRTANFSDFDEDKDFDMIWGNVKGEVFYTENVGTHKAYKFAKTVAMTAEGKPIKVSLKSDPYPVDWDGDGIIDLLIGSESADIVFFKGKKKSSTDFEAGVSIWTGKKTIPGAPLTYDESKASLDEMGEHAPYGNKDSYRVRLGVVDWNKDGKLDLLVGNWYLKDGKSSGNVYVFLRK
jgi:hypothetical protein